MPTIATAAALTCSFALKLCKKSPNGPLVFIVRVQYIFISQGNGVIVIVGNRGDASVF